MAFNLENYETVEDRLARFWQDHTDGRVHTSIHYYDENRILVRAEVYFDREDTRPVATGYAEEVRGASPVNRTSHAENAETSAIGRALANCGYAAKGHRPSREEMTKVARGATLAPSPRGKFEEACQKNGVKPEAVAKKAEVNLEEMTDGDLPKLRDAFKEMTSTARTKISTAQVNRMRVLLSATSTAKEKQTDVVSDILNRRVDKLTELSVEEADLVTVTLQSRLDGR